ncbi:DNA-directed RNA polymerase subunit beta [compost metagenome]
MWVRLLRWTVVPILLLCSIVAGLYVGYSVFGEQSGGEVFQLETWKHMLDLMFSKE